VCVGRKDGKGPAQGHRYRGRRGREGLPGVQEEDRRIYPAIDVTKSGTRKEELLTEPETLQKVWALRNAMQNMEDIEGLKFLFSKMLKTKTNDEFLSIMNQGA